MRSRKRHVTEWHMLRASASDEADASVASAWTFDAFDPVAVQLVIAAKPLPVTWTISRALLRDGLCSHRLRPAGAGDIRLYTQLGVLDNAQPDLRGVRRPVLVIDLMPPGDHLRLLTDGLIAQSFLRKTYELVTEEQEQRVVVQQALAAADQLGRVQS